MAPWLDAHGRLFNPRPRVSVLPLGAARPCVVLDDVLANPEGLVAWAATQRFERPQNNFYPGDVLQLPEDVTRRVMELFQVHARGLLGGRRTEGATVRLAMVTTAPGQLEPPQWQCHRDLAADDVRELLFAASVLYLFKDPSLGGTSFYTPRLPAAPMTRMIVDSQALDAAAFGERYRVRRGYMDGSNAFFERVAQVPAAWNRMIFYDGGMFHSGDIGRPDALSADPLTGRLTMNGFFTCRRQAA